MMENIRQKERDHMKLEIFLLSKTRLKIHNGLKFGSLGFCELSIIILSIQFVFLILIFSKHSLIYDKNFEHISSTFFIT